MLAKIPMLATKVPTITPREMRTMKPPGFVVIVVEFVKAPHVIVSATTVPITPHAMLERNIWRPFPKAAPQLTMIERFSLESI